MPTEQHDITAPEPPRPTDQPTQPTTPGSTASPPSTATPPQAPARRPTPKRRPPLHQHHGQPDDPRVPLRNLHDEHFAQMYARNQGRDQTECLLMSHPEAARWARSTQYSAACRHANKLLARINAIRAEIFTPMIMQAEEAQAVLSEIARADPADYLQAGPDGAWIAFGPESRNRRAVAGLKSKTITTGEGGPGKDATITEIRLRDPIAAIEQLAKLRGWHQPERLEITGARGGPVRIDWTLEIVDRNQALGRRAHIDVTVDEPRQALPPHADDDQQKTEQEETP